MPRAKRASPPQTKLPAKPTSREKHILNERRAKLAADLRRSSSSSDEGPTFRTRIPARKTAHRYNDRKILGRRRQADYELQDDGELKQGSPEKGTTYKGGPAQIRHSMKSSFSAYNFMFTNVLVQTFDR